MIRKRWIPLIAAGLLTIGIAEPVCDEEEENGDNGVENGAEEPSGADDDGEDAGGDEAGETEDSDGEDASGNGDDAGSDTS